MLKIAGHLTLGLTWAISLLSPLEVQAAVVAKASLRSLILRMNPKELSLSVPGSGLRLITEDGTVYLVTVKDKSKNLVLVEYPGSSLKVAKGSTVAVAPLGAKDELDRVGEEDQDQEIPKRMLKKMGYSPEADSPSIESPFVGRVRRNPGDPAVYNLHHKAAYFMGGLDYGSGSLVLIPKSAATTAGVSIRDFLPGMNSRASCS